MGFIRLTQIALVVVASLTCSMGKAVMITEDFDSAPGSWVGSGNTTAPQNFGWSNTNNAGGVLGAGVGEAGGRFIRETLGVYSTDVGSLDPSSDALSMTGRGRFTFNDGGGNVLLGWFDDTTSLAWEPDNFIGIRTDSTDVFISRFANGSGLGETLLQGGLGLDNSFSFTWDYDPSANAGNGAITATINGGAPVVVNLGGGTKDAFTNLNRFGMFTLFNGGTSVIDAFWDDLGYTSEIAPNIPEPSSLALWALGGVGTLAASRRRSLLRGRNR